MLRQQRRQDRGVGGQGRWRVGHAARHPQGMLGHRVDVRGRGQGVVVGPDVIGPQRVDGDQDQVEAGRGRRRLAVRAAERRDRREQEGERMASHLPGQVADHNVMMEIDRLENENS